jgi:hypothetical protein
MEAVRSFKMYVISYQTICHHTVEHGFFHGNICMSEMTTTLIQQNSRRYIMTTPTLYHGHPDATSRPPRRYVMTTPTIQHGHPDDTSRPPRRYVMTTPTLQHEHPDTTSKRDCKDADALTAQFFVFCRKLRSV